MSHHTWSEPDGLLVWCLDCGALNEKGTDPECDAPGQGLFKELEPETSAERQEKEKNDDE